MAQVGRISGPLLQDNLLRNGSNLAFRNDLNATQLLLVDVNTGRIGINTATPNFELEVDGTTQTTNLKVEQTTTLPEYTISNSTISRFGDINLASGNAIVMANMETDQIRISDNIISTINSSANIDLRPEQYSLDELQDGLLETSRGVTSHYLYSFFTEVVDGFARGDINHSGDIDIDDVMGFLSYQNNPNSQSASANHIREYIVGRRATTEIFNGLEVFGDIHTPGNITFDGSITLGDDISQDTVTFGSEITSYIVPDQTDTYNLGSQDKQWQYLYTNLINGIDASTDELNVGLINVNLRYGGTLYVAPNGDDTNDGDHMLAPFATIKRALESADASGAQPVTIRIAAGTYQEICPLVIPYNVSIIGEDLRNVIVTPTVATQSKDIFHMNDSTTVSDLTLKDYYYNSTDNTGYGFRFAPNAVMNDRSPYVQNITALTSETSLNAGDAGRGAWIDGAELNSASPRATMLFHSVTFISPGADVINMTNGVRVEWLNSFTYFANRGLYAFNGVTGKVGVDGSTVEYGAELRSIGSANVYGNYGAVADGADTLMYLVQHNFGYVGSGVDKSNDLTNRIQANEVVELNSGTIHYVSTDHEGDFRVGDNFFIDLQTGQTSFNISEINVESETGLLIPGPGNDTTITSARIEVGNIRISDNTIESLAGDLDFTSATNTINYLDNTNVTGNVDITGNFSFGGTLNLAGDQTLDDRLTFNVEFEQDFNPHTTLQFDLGELSREWYKGYFDKLEINDITFDDNYITPTLVSGYSVGGTIRLNEVVKVTDAPVLDGTGEVYNELWFYDETNYQLNQDVTSTRVMLWTPGANVIDYGAQVGDYFSITKGSTIFVGQITGLVAVTSIDAWEYTEVYKTGYIDNNVDNVTEVTVTLGTELIPFGNLELRASGTGEILVPNNNVQIDNNLTVDEITNLQETNISGALVHVGNVLQTGTYSVTNATIDGNLDVSSQAQLEEILFDGNVITTTTTDADLELRASGTGKILVPNNDVHIENNLQVSDVNSSNVNVTLQTQFNEVDVSDITITQNNITTNNGNLDLLLRASGTGSVEVENTNVTISNTLEVSGTTSFEDDETNYEYGPELVVNGTFDNNVNGWSQTGGGSANDVNGNLQINATGAARNVSQEITVVPGKAYDFEAQFRSVTNGNSFYLRIFESGVGTLFEWNETSGLVNDQLLTYSFVAQTSAVDIIFRSVDNIVEWDNVSMFEDIGFVTTFTPVQVNINGTNTQTGNTVQDGNVTQTGNLNANGLTISNEITTTNFNINDNVIQNIREDLRLNTTNSNVTHSLSKMIYAMADGDTVDDFVGQTEKNIITLLANGTSAPDYALSYADVNRDSNTTTSDALAWLQYIQNGSTGDTTKDAFIKNVVEILLEDEFANPGKYNSIIFEGDYFRADLSLSASGTGNVAVPNNDVRVTQDLFAASISTTDITVTRDLELNEIVITDSIIEIDDNFISTTVSNANLELRAEGNVIIPINDVIMSNNLTVDGNTDIDNVSINGTITQVGNRNQIGNMAVEGTVTVSTSNIKSEIQFDDIIFNDNYIETTNSDADLELLANGTGTIILPSNDVRLRTNMTTGTLNSMSIDISDSLSAESLQLSSNTYIFDNVITTTDTNSDLELRSFDSDVRIEQLFLNNNNITTVASDISLNASNNILINATNALKLPVGTFSESYKDSNNIRFNSTFNTYEAFNNQKRITLNGVYSDNVRTSMLAHPTDNTINFTVENVEVGTVDALGLTTNGLEVDDISIQGNVIATSQSNADLDLRANGTGVLRIDDIDLVGNQIINQSGGALTIANTGYGKIRFDDLGAVRIPAGTTAEQPSFTPEIGMMRWNTEEVILETWDGTTFVTAAGNAATISADEMDDLILEYTLIFG